MPEKQQLQRVSAMESIDLPEYNYSTPWSVWQTESCPSSKVSLPPGLEELAATVGLPPGLEQAALLAEIEEVNDIGQAVHHLPNGLLDLPLDLEAPEFKPASMQHAPGQSLDRNAPEFLPASMQQPPGILLAGNAPEILPVSMQQASGLDANAQPFKMEMHWFAAGMQAVLQASDLDVNAKPFEMAVQASTGLLLDRDALAISLVAVQQKSGLDANAEPFEMEMQWSASQGATNMPLDGDAPEFFPVSMNSMLQSLASAPIAPFAAPLPAPVDSLLSTCPAQAAQPSALIDVQFAPSVLTEPTTAWSPQPADEVLEALLGTFESPAARPHEGRCSLAHIATSDFPKAVVAEANLGSPGYPTAGSQHHGFGTCTPCAFVHTKGCGNGVLCPFCHLCKPEERKRRAKDRRAVKRFSIAR